MKNKLEKSVIFVSLLCLAGVLLFIVKGNEVAKALHPDVFKITYQFMIIVVTGGGMSWLFKELSIRRERKLDNKVEYIELYKEIVTTYNQYKSIKRLLRARAVREITLDNELQEIILVEPYSELMSELNKIQLKFEFYKRHVSGNNSFFTVANMQYKKEEKKTLYSELKNIEMYLNKVVQEYESSLREDIETPKYLPLNNLDYVREFISKGKYASSERKDALKSFESIIEKLAKA
ncbi:MAG: hypothetical protein D3924_06755 [Candidatus Electrothrix sp. AR4]|nr:hypothetical protein [Candidatus Electrothrix sp. AR4]